MARGGPGDQAQTEDPTDRGGEWHKQPCDLQSATCITNPGDVLRVGLFPRFIGSTCNVVLRNCVCCVQHTLPGRQWCSVAGLACGTKAPDLCASCLGCAGLQETAYLQKYPGRAGYEWHNKVQKYTPPGSSVTAEVPLWDVVSALGQCAAYT